MKISHEELTRKTIRALRTCLSKVPFLRLEDIKKENVKGATKPDFLVKLVLPSGQQNLIVEVKASGQPRLVRDAVNGLMQSRPLFPGSYGVFMAPYISPQAAEILAKAGIGYIDFSGNCLLSFEQIYIEQGGKPNLFMSRRDLRSLYSP